MKPYNVYRMGTTWYYTYNGKTSEGFESKDTAEAAAQQEIINERKAERAKELEKKFPEKEDKGARNKSA